jgi:hypothetical protein
MEGILKKLQKVMKFSRKWKDFETKGFQSHLKKLFSDLATEVDLRP